MYAATFLRGGAFAWFEPYLTDILENKDHAKPKTFKMFKTFTGFETELKKVFGMVDEERAAA